ncbi:serine protease gd-like isoform X1 [Danaus plexippus]|uniref:serine protease gd-like isoform X1 n=1 Tax=Danaus plexippus TaxID=13037 RepID=UPI0013C4B19B|nr:serine protease gd-like isoform X1 [Danaus plexippus]
MIMTYRVFFSFLILGLLSVCGQQFNSPCPDYFGYRQDSGGIYGLITIKSFGVVSSLLVRANFTIAGRLPSTYAGSLQPIGTELYLLRDFNRGKTLEYRVSFPVVSPLPRLTSISVNDKLVCYGPGDSIGEVQYITTISLQHMLFYKTGTQGIYGHDTKLAEQLPATLPHTNGGDGILFYYYKNFNGDPWINYVNPFTIDNSKPVYVPPKPLTPAPVPEYVVTATPATRRPPRPEPDPLSIKPEPQSTKCGINSKNDNPDAIPAAPLIYNGVTYDPGEWPWLVAMYQRRFGNLNYICAGTLVTANHIVSAAHCIHRKSTYTRKKNIVIRAGIYGLEDWNDDIVTRSLKEVYIHEDYNSTTLENDILIMTLESPVPFNKMIQPACLWSGPIVLNEIVGKSGIVAGWGANEQGSGGKGIPRMVTMPVVSTEDCKASKPDFHRLTSSRTLCAGDRTGAGPCLGDSGGGLYLLHRGRWRLRGIVSLSLLSDDESQCDLKQYIVFTDAAQYMPWITDVLSIT